MACFAKALLRTGCLTVLMLGGSALPAGAESQPEGPGSGAPPMATASAEPRAPEHGMSGVARLIAETAELVRSGRLDRAETELESALEVGRVAATLLRRLQDPAFPLSLDELNRLEVNLTRGRPPTLATGEREPSRPTDPAAQPPAVKSDTPITRVTPVLANAPSCPAVGPEPDTPSPGAVSTERPAIATTASIVPRPTSEETPTHARLLARAQASLEIGDLSAARLLLERAVREGSPRGFFMLAETFDPGLAGNGRKKATTADLALAISLYRRARDLGVPEAENRLAALGMQASNP